MKCFKSLTFVCTTLLFAFAVSAEESAEERASSGNREATRPTSEADAVPPVSAKPPASLRPVVYKPPKLGKPARSVGGGSRGSSDTIPVMYLMVPDHVGQTAAKSPSLFWYIDRVPDPSVRIEFTVLDEDSIEPLFEKTLPALERAGLQRIRLSELGVELEPGREYEWSVALILDPDERSKDVVATGWIDRVESPAGLGSRVAGAGDAASAYAEAGLWYDAITAISDSIDGNPADAELRRQRAELFRQVGLEQAAAGSI